MGSRRWLLLIWAAFVARLGFYAAAFPLWEGFDEWAHFAVARHLSSGHLLAPRDLKVPLDVAVSLQYAPMPPVLRDLGRGTTSHEAFWALPQSERAAREASFRAIPREDAAAPSGIVAYEALQPPLYYWLMALPLRLIRHFSLGAQAFALRWAAILIASSIVPLVFLAGRAGLGSDVHALGCAVVVSLMPELAISVARVGNECLAVPLFTAATWLALRRKGWAALGAVLGLGLITKAYFLAALVGLAAAYWSARAIGLAALISGWWYARNLWTTGTVSGLDEAVRLRGTSPIEMLEGAVRIPWRRAIDSILFSHFYFGGWSGLMARSWMYHLLYLFIAASAIGLIGLWRRRQIRALVVIYGAFWLGQAYNVVLIYFSKGVPTSMGWYLYAVVGAQTALSIAGLGRILRSWAVAAGTILFGLLDLYTMNAIALPYYSGFLGRKANGSLAALHLAGFRPVEMFERLTAFKPAYLSESVLIAMWATYWIATLTLMATGVLLALRGKGE
jgi:hypothetical protein